jgi:hypothetical protein
MCLYRSRASFPDDRTCTCPSNCQCTTPSRQCRYREFAPAVASGEAVLESDDMAMSPSRRSPHSAALELLLARRACFCRAHLHEHCCSLSNFPVAPICTSPFTYHRISSTTDRPTTRRSSSRHPSHSSTTTVGSRNTRQDESVGNEEG